MYTFLKTPFIHFDIGLIKVKKFGQKSIHNYRITALYRVYISAALLLPLPLTWAAKCALSTLLPSQKYTIHVKKTSIGQVFFQIKAGIQVMESFGKIPAQEGRPPKDRPKGGYVVRTEPEPQQYRRCDVWYYITFTLNSVCIQPYFTLKQIQVHLGCR